jgi:DNA-directed RNA polymerase subunit K/omega
VSGEATEVLAAASSETNDGPFLNRFLLVAVASQRVVQIIGGSRPRVIAGIHKAPVVAVAEVVAGCVPYVAS